MSNGRSPDAGPPPEIEDAARRRSEARAARDWATADQLRAEIEGAGWKVVDAGTAYRLERTRPPDVEVGGVIRHGRSDAVPSRLDEPATGLATVVVVASRARDETAAALQGLKAGAPDGVDCVVVADGVPDAAVPESSDEPFAIEVVRTSAPLGHAAALNAGIRRARAPVVVLLDPSIAPEGDVISPLVAALEDPAVAIAGPFGLVSPNLRQFEESTAGDAVAIQGYLQAFRRADYVARGPFDEGFRFYRNLDIWWSLMLRDEGEVRPPRRAVVVPGLPLRRGEPRAWTDTPAAVRDRSSKRNFYRILDRFRTRMDLAI